MVILLSVRTFLGCIVCTVLITIVVMLSTTRQAEPDPKIPTQPQPTTQQPDHLSQPAFRQTARSE
jgi:hypothetical protein